MAERGSVCPIVVQRQTSFIFRPFSEKQKQISFHPLKPLLENYNTAVERSKRSLNLANELLEEDLIEYKNRMDVAKSAEELRKNYFKDEVPSYDSLEASLDAQISEMLNCHRLCQARLMAM